MGLQVVRRCCRCLSTLGCVGKARPYTDLRSGTPCAVVVPSIQPHRASSTGSALMLRDSASLVATTCSESAVLQPGAAMADARSAGW